MRAICLALALTGCTYETVSMPAPVVEADAGMVATGSSSSSSSSSSSGGGSSSSRSSSSGAATPAVDAGDPFYTYAHGGDGCQPAPYWHAAPTDCVNGDEFTVIWRLGQIVPCGKLTPHCPSGFSCVIANPSTPGATGGTCP